jgi:hypothetical protein
MVNRRDLIRGTLAAAASVALPACRLREIPGQLLTSPASLGHRLLDGTLPPVSVRRSARVVIAGGGIAGLAAARALKQQGIRDVVIIDMLDAPGGNSSYGTNSVSAYPWGAHYVPLVRKDCTPVFDLFRDLKIIVDEDAQGKPVYDEYCLSADPQERLWMYGRWQDGLVPTIGSGLQDRAELNRFFAFTERLKNLVGADGKPVFAIPVDSSSADPVWRALDALSIERYLRQSGYQSQRLYWYINYCCRDDYGSTATAISAWAGLHYFASRNGVAANADPSTVVTWPEGNGHLAWELLRSCGAEQVTNALVTHVGLSGEGVAVRCFDARLQRTVQIDAPAAVVCLPRFVACRVVEGLGLGDAADFSYAPWMVANLTLSRMPEGRGQQLAWDNVIYDSPLLGYVVATHQSLAQNRRNTVITYYWPLSGSDPAQERRRALSRSLSEWQASVVGDLLRVHPELEGHIENVDVRVWGHGMIRPTPGFIWGESRRSAAVHQPPVYFAHSDLSGVSIFEEAYCRGYEAGCRAAQRVASRVVQVT